MLCLTFLMGQHEPLQIPVQNTAAAIGTILELLTCCFWATAMRLLCHNQCHGSCLTCWDVNGGKDGWKGWWFDDGSWLIHDLMNACFLNLLNTVWSVLHLGILILKLTFKVFFQVQSLTLGSTTQLGTPTLNACSAWERLGLSVKRSS